MSLRSKGFAISVLALVAAGIGSWLLRDARARARRSLPSDEMVLATLVEKPGDAVELAREEVARDYDIHFRGRVVDATSGRPLARAKATLIGYAEEFRGAHVLAALESDLDGRFELRAPSWVTKAVRIESEDHSLLTLPVYSGHEEVETELEIRLLRAASLDVEVSGLERWPDADVRLGLRGYVCGAEDSVAHEPEAWRSFGEIAWEARTDSRGRVRFQNLPAKKDLALEIEVVSDGHRVYNSVERRIRLKPGESRVHTSRLGSQRVVGRVVDATGDAVPGLDLWLMHSDGTPSYLRGWDWENVIATATSGGDGRFSFDALVPGTWGVGPAPGEGEDEPRDDGIATVLTPFTVPEDGDATIELRVDRNLYIRGRVLDLDEEVALQCVVMYWWGGADGNHVATDEGGLFQIGPLAAGRCVLVARPTPDLDAEEDWQCFRRESEFVFAQAGDEDLVLRLRPAGSLSGRVEPCSDQEDLTALVEVVGETPLDSQGIGWVQEDGRFRVGSLAPGTYTLTASFEGDFVAAATGLEVAEMHDVAGVVLSPERGARLRIAFGPGTAESNAPRTPRLIDVMRDGTLAMQSWTQADETELLVPPGNLQVRVRRFDSFASTDGEVIELEESFSLAAGEERTLAVLR